MPRESSTIPQDGHPDQKFRSSDDVARDLRRAFDRMVDGVTALAQTSQRFHAVEKSLHTGVFELGRLLLVLYLTVKEERVSAALPERVKLQGRAYTRRPQIGRTLGTFFGRLRYHRTYLQTTSGGGLRINSAAIRRAEERDGKFVVSSNDDTLSAADLALGYKQLQRVEEAWRTLKSVLRMRPVFHWTPHRINAHISLTVLALLLERVVERACDDTWRNIRADLNQIKLAQLLSPNGTVWQVTDPRPETAKRLKLLKIKNPHPILTMR